MRKVLYVTAGVTGPVIIAGAVLFFGHVSSPPGSGPTCKQVLRADYLKSLSDPSYQASDTRPPECAGLTDEQYMQEATKVMSGG